MDQAGTDAAATLENWNLIDELPPKEPGDIWYLVSKTWLDAFRLYITALQNGDSNLACPGHVDNGDIVESEVGTGSMVGPDICIKTGDPDWRHDVKPDISAEAYESVPADVWHFLMLHFKGGPAVPRCCARDASCGVVKLETPIHISIVREGYADALRVKVPPSLSYNELLSFAVKCLGLSSTCTLEDHSGDAPRDLGSIAKLVGDPTLQALGVQDEMALRLQPVRQASTNDAVMDEVNPDIIEDDKSDAVNASTALVKMSDECPVNASSKKPPMQQLRLPPPQPTFQCFRSADAVTDEEGTGSLPGFAGLQNLGNTCFMNSALQCLTHCVPVLRVFLSSRFEDDLNPENPLGKKGEMAVAFGELAQKLWRGNVKHVSPDGFKRTLGRHAAQFQGYEQHDSQEFLSYLLDMLHEDLNRVRNKPYIEEGEDAGRSDEELAKEAWNSYRARNDSAIVDHFQGLLKSTLDCPNCGHHKRKFDPFMYLSVPLPGANTVLRRFTFVPMAGKSRPQEYCVKVYKHDTVGAFLKAVSLLIGLPGTALSSLTAVLQKSSFSAYSRDREYCTLYVLEDMAKELPPERHSFNKDKLLVYQNPDDADDDSNLKLAAIVPPGGTDSLPLLLRVPHTAIEIETVSLSTTGPGQFSGNKRLSLRSDCELARRVEDLLTPFKKQRVHHNLIYTPPSTGCATDVLEPTNSDADGPAAAMRDTAVAKEVDVEMSGAPPDTDAKLYTTLDAVTAAEPEAGTIVCGVPADASHHASEDSASMQQADPNGDANDMPAGTMDEDCVGSAGAVSSDALVEGSMLASVAESQQLSSMHESMETTGVIVHPHAHTQPIMGDVPVPAKLDLRGLPHSMSCAGHAVASTGTSLHDRDATVDDVVQAEAVSPGPAVRLLAVEDNGSPLFKPPLESSTQFFRLDVRMEDAKQVIDVEAMTKVDEHSSLDQLKEHHEYTLEDCIGTYLAEEILGPTDLWHCPKCRMDVRAKKALDVWCLPEVLIIHLKRFSYSGFGFYSTYSTTSSKINNLVTFPLKGLDMTKLVHGSDADAVYDCFAVSNHMGSVSGGHYTAYCLHEQALLPDGDKNLGWHSYNDRTVTPTSGTNVVTPSAYVLFYRRRSCSEQDPADILRICRQEMQLRQQEVQAAPSSNVVDLFPGKPRYAHESSPALSAKADSRPGMWAGMLADSADLQDGGTDIRIDSHQVTVSGQSHAPLDSTVLARFQSVETEHDDETDSQKAVVNFPTDPVCTIQASAPCDHSRHANGIQRPLDSEMLQQFQDHELERNDDHDSQKAVVCFPTDPSRTHAVHTPSNRADNSNGSQRPIDAPSLQRFHDEEMEANDETEGHEATLCFPVDPSCNLRAHGVGSAYHDIADNAVADCSPSHQQQDSSHAHVVHTSRARANEGSGDASGPGQLAIMKRPVVNKCLVLAGGNNGEVNVDRDLPMAGKEVSENEDAAMEDGSMEVGTPPDQPVHDMSPKIICPE